MGTDVIVRKGAKNVVAIDDDDACDDRRSLD